MHEQPSTPDPQSPTFRLTQYSHGAGCGCKIAPSVLDHILKSGTLSQQFPQLLVGNEERDDAAVYDLGDGTAVVSTTDFFMPIVDDPADFGRIASVNAISDVYAMGGTPLLAIAILGWPVNTLLPEVANEVIEGARSACSEVGIPLAGGHSIDSPEPIFGLAVTGRLKIENLKKNGGAIPGCKLFLTKPLGVGILTTAQKKGVLKPEHAHIAPDSMKKLNKAGERFGLFSFVKAMTDVTGFGLLGHLSEMCDASDASAIIHFDEVPTIDRGILDFYLEQKCVPGGTNRNWDSYGHKIAGADDYKRKILADPQTSGGLLVAVEPGFEAEFQKVAAEEGYDLQPFGFFIERQMVSITVL
ncbi:MAG: selenide, water dikinase SelD [Haliscomenobacteraceae bacterium CHB4]|nr:Selenide, water dikinase [Saprospiraceae bacterium]MCE7922877.1 selenide, water dikinase SelD [Haliscomenobacteraceae bacterium CHB4]